MLCKLREEDLKAQGHILSQGVEIFRSCCEIAQDVMVWRSSEGATAVLCQCVSVMGLATS